LIASESITTLGFKAKLPSTPALSMSFSIDASIFTLLGEQAKNKAAKANKVKSFEFILQF
jgi:hypothetical protein